MTTTDKGPLIARIHELVTLHLEGRASAADRAALDSLVESSTDARRVFADYIGDTSRLRWMFAAPTSELLGDIAADIPVGGRAPRWALATAALLSVGLAAGLAVFFLRPSPAIQESKNASRTVATLTRLAGVRWSDPEAAWNELSRLEAGDRLRFDAGEVEIVYDSGVDLVIRGPAAFDVRGVDRVYSAFGTITARVGDGGQGFVLETPVAKVVDLGTEFNIQIAPSGTTDVAVLRGLVDLSVTSPLRPAAGGSSRRLRQGEGMRVDSSGTLDRLVSIASDQFPTRAGDLLNVPTSRPVIAAVRDNSDGDVQKFYRIVRAGLREDAPAFVDRNHEWNGVDDRGLPEFLKGIEYVMPYNNDKFMDRLELLVDIARPAIVYVFMSDHVPVPPWLAGDFVDTGVDIGLDEARNRFKPGRVVEVGSGRSIDTVFSVWRREVPEATTLRLGPVQPLEDRTGFNMYGIAAAPLLREGSR